MSKTGPPPTPTAILAARGSWRAKEREGEPMPTDPASKPGWLTGDAEAAWDEIVPILQGSGVATSFDSVALARYCTLLVRWIECEAFIREHGATYYDENKMLEYPHVSRASRLADQLLKLEQQFGMTASARVNLVPRKKESAKDGNDDSASSAFMQLVG
jgi:P27 family predicted phage terminase small subunit